MILIDLNQVLLSGLMAQIAGQKNIKIEEGLLRHMVLNILRGHVKQFRQEYGEIILCCDNKTYWRKSFFPYYKASRKKAREKSDLDWHLIFSILGNLKQEFKNHFPYKVIDVDGAEADDVIGVLSTRHSGTEKVLILSSDGDFIQLQKYKNVKQYNPATKKFIVSKNPVSELKEKIIQGDRGDGIPNIFSPDNCFVLEQRQKPITKIKLETLLNEHHENYAEDTKRGYIRNKTLIDLEMTPKDIQKSIIDTYENYKTSPKSELINYFMEKKLKNLMDVIEEF